MRWLVVCAAYVPQSDAGVSVGYDGRLAEFRGALGAGVAPREDSEASLRKAAPGQALAAAERAAAEPAPEPPEPPEPAAERAAEPAPAPGPGEAPDPVEPRVPGNPMVPGGGRPDAPEDFGRDLVQAEQDADPQDEPVPEPEWHSLSTKVAKTCLAIVLVLVPLLAAAVSAWLWYDRRGVDEGKALPSVSLEAGETYLEQNSAGYDRVTKEWLPTRGGDVLQQVRHVGGPGMQAFFLFTTEGMQVFVLVFLFACPMIAYCRSGEPEEGLLAWTAATFGDRHAQLARFQDRWQSTLAGGSVLGLAVLDALGVCAILAWCAQLLLQRLPALDAEAQAAGVKGFCVLVDGLPPKVRSEPDLPERTYEDALKGHLCALVTAERAKQGLDNAAPVQIQELVLCRDTRGALRTVSRLAALKTALRIEREKHRSGEVERLTAEAKDVCASLDQDALREDQPVTRCYCVFRREQDATILRELLGDGSEWFHLRRQMQPAERHFQGAGLSAFPGPEPEDVLWEHQHCSRGERYGRKVVALVVELLLYAVFVYSVATLMRTRLAWDLTGPLACQDAEGAAPKKTVQEVLSMARPSSCDCAGIGPGAVVKHRELWGKCNEYMLQIMEVKMWIFGMIAGIFVASEVLEAINENLAQFERPLSSSEAERNLFSTMVRLYGFGKVLVVFVVTLQLFGGHYMAFTPSWHRNVGEFYIINVVVNIVVIWWVRFFKSVLCPILGKFAFRFFSHQEVANKVGYFRFEFEPSKRSAEVLMVLSSVVPFYTTMPCLLPILLVWFPLQTYWDRLFIVRGCRRQNLSIDLTIAHFMAWGVVALCVVHCAVAAWSFGSPLLFPMELWASAEKYRPPPGAAKSPAEALQRLGWGQSLGLHSGAVAALPPLLVGFAALAASLAYAVCSFRGLLKARGAGASAGRVFADVKPVAGQITSYAPEAHPLAKELFETYQAAKRQSVGSLETMLSGGPGAEAKPPAPAPAPAPATPAPAPAPSDEGPSTQPRPADDAS